MFNLNGAMVAVTAFNDLTAIFGAKSSVWYELLFSQLGETKVIRVKTGGCGGATRNTVVKADSPDKLPDAINKWLKSNGRTERVAGFAQQSATSNVGFTFVELEPGQSIGKVLAGEQ